MQYIYTPHGSPSLVHYVFLVHCPLQTFHEAGGKICRIASPSCYHVWRNILWVFMHGVILPTIQGTIPRVLNSSRDKESRMDEQSTHWCSQLENKQVKLGRCFNYV